MKHGVNNHEVEIDSLTDDTNSRRKFETNWYKLIEVSLTLKENQSSEEELLSKWFDGENLMAMFYEDETDVRIMKLVFALFSENDLSNFSPETVSRAERDFQSFVSPNRLTRENHNDELVLFVPFDRSESVRFDLKRMFWCFSASTMRMFL